ncbi:MAG: methyltransferase [Sciscionella sp.]
MDGRCAFSGQSFFDALPAGGDVYVPSNVIHDWGDDEATAILRRCAEAVGDRGRLVVIEDGDRAMVAEMDLRMLVPCGARARSIDDYTAVATAAGLPVANIHATPLSQVSIECVPTGARMSKRVQHPGDHF